MVTGALVFATGALILQDMICMNQARIEKYKLYPLHRGGMKAKGKRIKGDRWTQWKWLIGDSLLLAIPFAISRITAQASATNSSHRACAKCEQPKTSIPCPSYHSDHSNNMQHYMRRKLRQTHGLLALDVFDVTRDSPHTWRKSNHMQTVWTIDTFIWMDMEMSIGCCTTPIMQII